MKVALYLRVANDDQDKALSTQEFYLRDWANKQGHEVTSVFYDISIKVISKGGVYTTTFFTNWIVR